MVDILFPVGRLVQGDVHEMQKTDSKGAPLVVKNGPNNGQPRTEMYFAVAFAKSTEVSWRDTDWGRQLVAEAMAAFPQGQPNRADFAWKVVDGDSAVPDKSNTAPNTKEGFAGHWVVRFTTGYQVTIMNRDGTQQIIEKGVINLGDYVQPFATVNGNQSTQSPGVYINPNAIAFVEKGPRIEKTRDYSNVGFGQAPLPQNAQVVTTPQAGGFNPASAMAPAAAPVPQQPAANVAPQPAMLQPQLPPAVPAAPAAPAAPVGPRMTALATATYDQYIAAGWTDALLKQHGYME